MNVGIVHLGCSKNLVDTEMTIGLFKKNGYKIVNNEEDADIIIINTCGFIEPAKQEAINTILEMAKYKEKRCKYLIVMGCLVQRYIKDLEKLIPEVDLWIKFDSYSTIWKQIEETINKKADNKYIAQNKQLDFLDRTITTGKNFAYIRIADGCDNFCTFCAIPNIRGRFKSRKIENILEEAQLLAKEGYKEIILIAQDTTKYGIDLYGKPELACLLKKLCKIEGIEWIRFLYSYPETITDELIEVVKNEDKICKYFDIPIQHISDNILKKMNRKSSKQSIINIIGKIRKEIPNVVLRTTVMVGFPGETKENFEELYDFIENTKFEKLGVFEFSKEDGTPAEKLANQVNGNTKKSRYNKIMSLQQKISNKNLKKQIGKSLKVLIENKTSDGKYYMGRCYMDVPDIDGTVYVSSNRDLKLGEFKICTIENTNDYDLKAIILE